MRAALHDQGPANFASRGRLMRQFRRLQRIRRKTTAQRQVPPAFMARLIRARRERTWTDRSDPLIVHRHDCGIGRGERHMHAGSVFQNARRRACRSRSGRPLQARDATMMQLKSLARAVRIEGEFARRGIKLRGSVDRCGPCPRCGGKDRFSVNLKKQVFNCRGCGANGGGAVDLVMFLDGCDFNGAVGSLVGPETPKPQSWPRPSATADRPAKSDDNRALAQMAVEGTPAHDGGLPGRSVSSWRS